MAQTPKKQQLSPNTTIQTPRARRSSISYSQKSYELTPNIPDLDFCQTPQSIQTELLTPTASETGHRQGPSFDFQTTPSRTSLSSSGFLLNSGSVTQGYAASEDIDRARGKFSPLGWLFGTDANDDGRESNPAKAKRQKNPFASADFKPYLVDLEFVQNKKFHHTPTSPIINKSAEDGKAETKTNTISASSKNSAVIVSVTEISPSPEPKQEDQSATGAVPVILINSGEKLENSPTKALKATSPRSRKKAEVLLWDDASTYSEILPWDLVERLKEKEDEDGGKEEERIKKRCVALTMTGARCRNFSKLDEKEVSKHLQNLSALLPYFEFSEAITPILRLAENTTCKRWHKKKAKCRLYKLWDHLYPSINNLQGEVPKTELDMLKDWVQALTAGSVQSEKNTTIAVQGVYPTQKKYNSSTATAQNVSREVSLQTTPIKTMPTTYLLPSVSSRGDLIFVPRQNDLTTHHHLNFHFRQFQWSKIDRLLSAETLVQKTFKQPLTPGDIQKEGYIYVYWDKASFGYVKIGHTRNTTRRLLEWKRKCGFNVQEHNNGSGRKVRHPLRVEKLIHAELKDQRLEEPKCQGCGKRHVEWFEVGENFALQVVENWTKWMQEESPYDDDGNLKENIRSPSLSSPLLTPNNSSRSRSLSAGTSKGHSRSPSRGHSRRTSGTVSLLEELPFSWSDIVGELPTSFTSFESP